MNADDKAYNKAIDEQIARQEEEQPDWRKCNHKYGDAPDAKSAYEFNRFCGARICAKCGHHKGLARCYCGWSSSGGNGYNELLEMGETIEPEDY